MLVQRDVCLPQGREDFFRVLAEALQLGFDTEMTHGESVWCGVRQGSAPAPASAAGRPGLSEGPAVGQPQLLS